MMLSISAPSMAQDVKSQVTAITKVVVDAKGDVNATKAQVKDFMKANKRTQKLLQVSDALSSQPRIMSRLRFTPTWL